MILHTVNKSPVGNSAFSDCLRLCTAGSAVVLIEDGVYAASSGTAYSEQIVNSVDISFYALQADVLARGLSDRLCSGVTVVDDSQFVALVVEHHSTQSWY